MLRQKRTLQNKKKATTRNTTEAGTILLKMNKGNAKYKNEKRT